MVCGGQRSRQEYSDCGMWKGREGGKGGRREVEIGREGGMEWGDREGWRKGGIEEGRREKVQPIILWCGCVQAEGTSHPALYCHSFMTEKPHWIGGVSPDDLIRGNILTCTVRYRHQQTLGGCGYDVIDSHV